MNVKVFSFTFGETILNTKLAFRLQDKNVLSLIIIAKIFIRTVVSEGGHLREGKSRYIVIVQSKWKVYLFYLKAKS